MAGRAFLSHQSRYKDLVIEVADLLGRDKCILDIYNFETGKNFSDLIKQHLDASDVFVLFLSKEALESDWVRLEIERARELKYQSRFLVYIVDDRLSLKDVPDWLKEFKLYTDTLGAYAIFLDVDLHLRDLNPSYSNADVFIGRSDEVRQFEISRYSDKPKKVFLLHGLSGMGRKAIIRHISRSRLYVRKNAIVKFKLGETLQTLLIRIVEIYKSKEFVIHLIEETDRRSDEEIIKMICDYLHELVNIHQIVPIFVDEGGMVDNSGFLRPEFGLLFDSIAEDRRQPYFFAALNRRPNSGSSGASSYVPIRVQELNNEDTRILVNARIQIENMDISEAMKDEVVQLAAGHPDLVILTIKDIKNSGYISEGIKERLVAYYSEFLAKYLDTAEKISVCRPLIEYERLPLQVLLSFCQFDSRNFNQIIENLIGLSIIVRSDKWVSLSPSLLHSARRNFQPLNAAEKKRFSTQIFKYMEAESSDEFSIHLMEIFYESSMYSESTSYPNTYPIFRTSIYTLLSSFYRSRRYSKFIETYKMMKEKVSEIDQDYQINYYYVSSLINTYNFDEAKASLRSLRLDAKERSFLSGLLARKKGEWSAAMESFNQAEQQGYRGPAILSEIARCYLMLGELENALVYIERFQERAANREDSYYLDIAIQINYKMEQWDEVERLLFRLEKVNYQAYLFRKAYILFQSGETREAYDNITECVIIDQRNLPEYNIQSLLARCSLSLAEDSVDTERESFIEQAEQAVGKMSQISRNSNPVISRYKCAILALRKDFNGAARLAESSRRLNEEIYNKNMLYIFTRRLLEDRLTTSERTNIERDISIIQASRYSDSGTIRSLQDNRFNGMLD